MLGIEKSGRILYSRERWTAELDRLFFYPNENQLLFFCCCRGHNQHWIGPALKWFGPSLWPTGPPFPAVFSSISFMPCPEWLALTTMQASQKVREFLRKSTRRSKNESLPATAGEEAIFGNWNLHDVYVATLQLSFLGPKSLTSDIG